MRHSIIAAVAMWPLAVQGEEGTWAALSGDEIKETLTGRTLLYETAWQDFRASGRTLYNAGHDSWGYWRVQDDQYCSQWPPQDLWTCYKVERRGEAVRFVGSREDITEAVFKD